MKLNPEHIEEVLKLINQGPYFRLLNIDILSLEEGRCIVEADIERKHMNCFGGMHGGVYESTLCRNARERRLHHARPECEPHTRRAGRHACPLRRTCGETRELDLHLRSRDDRREGTLAGAFHFEDIRCTQLAAH